MPTVVPLSVLKYPVAKAKMLFQRREIGDFYPFSSDSITYFYFCRNAIWHAVDLLGLKGCEFLVPSYHHGVEIEALLDAGAKLQFYRVDRRMRVDVDDIKRKITPATRAIYLIHYLGFPGPTNKLRLLANQENLLLFEDCALALLSADGHRFLGSTGDVSFYCLYKTLSVPHGGALVFNDGRTCPPLHLEAPPLDSTLSHFAASMFLWNPDFGRLGKGLHRLLKPAGKAVFSATARIPRVDPGTMHFNPDHVRLGMSRLVRHLLTTQDLRGIIERRRRNFSILLHELADVHALIFEDLPEGVCPLFYPVPVENKEALRDALLAKGIETIDFWRTGHPLCRDSEFPESASLRRSIVELPCHQDLSEEMVRHMARIVRKALIG